MNTFSKDRLYLLGIILSVISLSAGLFSSLVYYRQKSLLIADYQIRTQYEVELIGSVLTNLLPQNASLDIKQTLNLFASNHNSIVLLEAVLDGGAPVFSYHTQQSLQHAHIATTSINYGKHKLNLAIAHDSSNLIATLHELRRNLTLMTIVLALFMGLMLWFLLFRWLIKPMRLQILRQTQVLRDTVAYTEGFFNAVNAHKAIIDSNGIIMSTNQAWQKFARSNGHQDDPAMIGQPYATVATALYQCPQNEASWKRGITEVILGLSDLYIYEYSCSDQGKPRWFIMRTLPIANSNPPIFIITHEDISSIKESQLALEDAIRALDLLSTTDKLTQLYNRTKLDEVLREATKRAKRYTDIPLAIIMADIDYFKHVNDTYGHQAGDRTLVQFAQIVRKNIRESDIAGRWGGEEFLIICPNTNIRGAYTLAEKLRNILEHNEITMVGTITASFGVAEFVPNDSIDSLLGRADRALYSAKDQGRNRVVT